MKTTLTPYFYTDTMLSGEKFEYTFLYDFDIADHFGENAIRDTYKRALNEWKSNIRAVAEIYIALNMRCWFWYENGNNELSGLYEELFYKLRNFVYDDNTPYSKKELSEFFRLTD